MKFNQLYILTSIIGLSKLIQAGKMTFYGSVENGDRPSKEHAGACGDDPDYFTTDYYVALNQVQYTKTLVNPLNPNTASICGKCIKIMHNNKYCVGKIIDSCPGCDSNKGIDVSPDIFKRLEDLDVGIIDIDWEYLDSCSSLGECGTCSAGGCSSSSGSSSNDSSNNTTKPNTSTSVTKTNDDPIPTNSAEGEANTTTETNDVVNVDTNDVNTDDNTEMKELYEEYINNKDNFDYEKLYQKYKSNREKAKEEEGEAAANDDTNYAIPITGAVAFTCAASIGLVYAKRNSNKYEELKQRFPEAFTTIKRSLSRGSSNIRRGLSRSLSRGSSNLRRGLSNSGTSIKRRFSGRKPNISSSSSSSTSRPNRPNRPNRPKIRTRAEYRQSLNDHYNLSEMANIAQMYNNNFDLIEKPQPVLKHSYQYKLMESAAAASAAVPETTTIDINDQ